MSLSQVAAGVRRRVSAHGLLHAAGLIGCVATVFGFLGSLSWFLDLFSHFRVQWFLTLATAAAVMGITKQHKTCVTFALFALSNLAVIAPMYVGAPSSSPEGRPVRVLWANVNTEWGDPTRVARVIGEFAPDILVLAEVSQKWLATLAPALAGYPHSEAVPREDHFGIALYSKFPLAHPEIRYLGAAEVPTLVAEAESDGGRFTIVGTHPLPPSGPDNTRLRDAQLAQLPGVAAAATSPVLLLGDLNATPWCPAFQRLLRESGLRDSSRGRGVQPTWPTFMPLLGIPIDHCLLSPELTVMKKTVGPRVGSDHYPLLVEFTLNRGRRNE